MEDPFIDFVVSLGLTSLKEESCSQFSFAVASQLDQKDPPVTGQTKFEVFLSTFLGEPTTIVVVSKKRFFSMAAPCGWTPTRLLTQSPVGQETTHVSPVAARVAHFEVPPSVGDGLAVVADWVGNFLSLERSDPDPRRSSE